jgi:predicted Zn finger-like uncharacterized protein
MIIQCKNCDTKFRVSESEIGNHGRMVCCSVCEYEWLHIPKKENIKLGESNEPIVNQIASKSIKKNIASIIYSLIIFIALSLFLYVEREFLVDQHAFFEIFYKLFDYHNAEGLKIELSKPIKEEYGDDNFNRQVRYKIPIKIINDSDKTKFVQTVKIIGYDENNKILNMSTNLRKDIPPHSEFNVSICPDEEIGELDFIFVGIGNIHDLKNFHHNHEYKKSRK